LRDNPVIKDELSVEILDGVQPHQYLKEMENDACWEDGVMLSAASMLYKKSIKIVLQDGREFTIGTEFVDNGTLTVGYESISGDRRSLAHFVSLLSDDCQEDQLANECNIHPSECSYTQVSAVNT
jgi:hypothetical protein